MFRNLFAIPNETHSLSAPISLKNDIPRANQDEQNQTPCNRHKNRNKIKHVDSTKEDMHLLGQLYMPMHARVGNSDRLFEVENTDCSPSLSKHGVLRSRHKSDLLSRLEVDCQSDFHEADAKLINGAHMKLFLGRMRASSHSVTTLIRR